MFFAIDFDGTVVEQSRPYDDLTTPLRFMPGAKEALLSLKRAGHKLLLWSARSSRALLEDPMLDPLVRTGARRVDVDSWRERRALHTARYFEMLDFVERELPGVFDAVDDGAGGKPHVDFFVDDRAMKLGRGLNGFDWPTIAQIYGEPVYGVDAEAKRLEDEAHGAGLAGPQVVRPGIG